MCIKGYYMPRPKQHLHKEPWSVFLPTQKLVCYWHGHLMKITWKNALVTISIAELAKHSYVEDYFCVPYCQCLVNILFQPSNCYSILLSTCILHYDFPSHERLSYASCSRLHTLNNFILCMGVTQLATRPRQYIYSTISGWSITSAICQTRNITKGRDSFPCCSDNILAGWQKKDLEQRQGSKQLNCEVM